MPQREARYPRLGEQIDRLVRSLAAVKGWNMAHTMRYVSNKTHYGPDMIHRWRQGKLCPSLETLEILVEIGKEDAILSREWGESTLNAAKHNNTGSIVNRWWGPKEILSIPCNLPSRDRSHLIGRQAEITRLLRLLSPEHAAPLITIDGIGGVGKTALVLEVSHMSWRASIGEIHDSKAPHFEAIIFVSAKQQYLTADGILLSHETKRTLRDIYREIAVTLERSEIMHVAPQEQLSTVYKVLGRQRTLLIVDNLETMEDKQEIMSFLYELPPSVKVIITTRERVVSFSPIRLEQLPKEEALSLIEKEAQEKEAEINRGQALQLYHHIGGIPAALVYAIGQIASGYTVQTVLEQVPKAGSDVARFCFEGSLGPLREQPAHHLLMAIAMFAESPLFEAIAETAGFSKDQILVEDSLTQLSRLSLIRRHDSRRYTMLPLTREYALSELRAHASFEQEARIRWINWYLDFTSKYGGKDWEDWDNQYNPIEKEWGNLLTVFDWCATHEQYDALQKFWQDKHIVNFTQIYGYWDDRLDWLKWLIEAAERRGKWSHVVRTIVDIGSTLTLMSQFEEADWYFQKALAISKSKYVDDQVQLLLLFQKIAFLRINQKVFDDALDNALIWLDRAKALLDAITPRLEEKERSRRRADFYSYRGLFFYKQKDYNQAKVYYHKMLDEAKSVKWERAAFFAQNHLAHIAIAQNRLDEAEALLQSSLPIEKDKRLSAFHKYNYAYFYQKKGDKVEAWRLAKEALDRYESLGMKQEAQEMEELRQLLSV